MTQIQLLGSCLVFSASLAVGQLLFKLAADDVRLRLGWSLIRAVLSPWLIAAIILYGATTVLWIWILGQTTLTRAYPFALIGAAFVPLLAAFFLGEPISVRYGVGMVLVILGVAITQSHS